MVDRQDIDALLISSLYGELSSADEARLSAHLESHPADRTALANLSRAREVVRESRILQVQFEPPQSVSALLMQEAVRRAPKATRDSESVGWFQRFMRSFIAHPAMAAAATLVLVIGVAGTVYMKKGDNFATATKDNAPELATSPSTSTTPRADEPGADRAAPADSADPAAKAEAPADLAQARGSAAAPTTTDADDFKVRLDETETEKKSKADGKVVITERAAERTRRAPEANANGTAPGGLSADEGSVSKNRRDADDSVDGLAKDATRATGGFDRNQPAKEPPKPSSPASPVTAAKPPAKSAPRLEVTTPKPAPKELGDSSREDTFASKGDASGAAGGATSPRSDARTGTAAPPPPPPPPPPAATVASEQKELQQDKASAELAWAKERHGKVIAAVAAGKCELAATIAVEISNRAPSYYAASVADDRKIKGCAPYIAQQREREAERVQRAKATQRRATDEAPARNSTK